MTKELNPQKGDEVCFRCGQRFERMATLLFHLDNACPKKPKRITTRPRGWIQQGGK